MSDLVRIRKFQTVIERAFHEGGPAREQPHLRGSIAAVVANPFAGRYEANLMPFMEALQPLAVRMGHELVAALGVAPSAIEGYGKGAIVGAAGEMEHAAIWHTPGGAGARAAIGNPKAQVPSSKKIGAIGAQLDIPMVYIHASYVRSHYDAMPVVVADGPRADEIVYALVMTTGARIHARLGGLAKGEITGADGQR
jgi:hypothetical protein